MADFEVIYMPDRSGNTIRMKRCQGRLWPCFPDDAIRGVSSLQTREDDAIVVTYPKSGTHWVWEIARLLTTGITEAPVAEKASGMIELLESEKLEAMSSPRILNTHSHFELMPRDVLGKKNCKLIYVTRDPRDVAVSFYNHHIKMFDFYGYRGSWHDYFLLHLDGQVDYDSWFRFTRGWEQGIKDNPGLKLHITSYEALQENTHEEVEKLATFLGASTDAQFISKVIEQSSFEHMRATNIKNKPHRQDREDKENNENNDPVMYRKGKVGDWKDWFTVAQAEQFDCVFEKEMKGTGAYRLYSNLKSSETLGQS